MLGDLQRLLPVVGLGDQEVVRIDSQGLGVPGVQGVLGQSFVGGIGDVFGTNPKAQLYFEGGSVGGIATQQVNPALKPGKTIISFPWPTAGPRASRT